MKFEKCAFPKLRQKSITPCRVANAKRYLKKEQDKFPLLADWIAESQPTPEERINDYDLSALKKFQYLRACTAKSWQKARRIIYLLDNKERKAILTKWNQSAIPKSSEYMLDFLRRHGFQDQLGD